MAVPEILGTSLDKVVAEFIGTFVLVFTVGNNALNPSPGAFGVLSIALTLMAMVYALGPVSGGHFNPAVTLGCALAGKTEPKQAVLYVFTQLVAGIAGAFAYVGLNHNTSFNLQPGAGMDVNQVVTVEILYTCMLCFVVLCTACSKKNDGNGFFGIAIGFVIVAGGYGAGAISGGVFNPAVALGIDLSSAKESGVYYIAWYIPAQITGAAFAVVLHRLCYPEEYGTADAPSLVDPEGLVRKCICEAVGTFFLVLTVCLNVKLKAVAASLSIAAALLCMVYALGPVSGGHFNPAVTLAVLTSRRNKLSPKHAAAYVGVQFFAAMLAGVVFAGALFKFKLGTMEQLTVAPRKTITLPDALFCEMVFTCVLCLVVLTTATTQKALKQTFGLAIGMTIVVGGVASGKISGGSLNPAASLGRDFASMICGNGLAHPENLPSYVGAELLGGLVASAAFFAWHPNEFKGDGLDRWLADE